MMIQPLTVGIAIFTLNSAHHLLKCITPLLNSPLKPKILVVDSSSTDDSVETAIRLGAETHVIPKEEFNHGTTREKARQLLKTDIVVMLTPDAYAIDSDVLGILIQPIVEKKASVAYARQIPHDGADFLEAFPRYFNYPAQSHIRSIENLEEYGVYTFFCSDSCAAYSNTALNEIGSFQSVLLGEDTVAAASFYEKAIKLHMWQKQSSNTPIATRFGRNFAVILIQDLPAKNINLFLKEQEYRWKTRMRICK